MTQFTVRKDSRYRCTLQLAFLESLAGNSTIVDKLTKAGFVDVEVTGSGNIRQAEGTWPYEDETAELPSQIVHIEEVTEPV